MLVFRMDRGSSVYESSIIQVCHQFFLLSLLFLPHHRRTFASPFRSTIMPSPLSHNGLLRPKLPLSHIPPTRYIRARPPLASVPRCKHAQNRARKPPTDSIIRRRDQRSHLRPPPGRPHAERKMAKVHGPHLQRPIKPPPRRRQRRHHRRRHRHVRRRLEPHLRDERRPGLGNGCIDPGKAGGARRGGEEGDAHGEMVVLGQEGGDAGFLAEHGGREGKVHRVGEEGVGLAAADKGLAVGAVLRSGVVPVEAGEVEEGRGEAEGGGLFGRGEGVVGWMGVAPVGEVEGEVGKRGGEG